MKEARIITICSVLLGIISTILAVILYKIYPTKLDYIGILTNIYCGIIVGLVTSIVQYFVQKRKIIKTIYNAYFDIYRSYYYAINNKVLFHYNALSVYKKFIELNPKIIDALDEYQGIFSRCDRTYRKLNPPHQLRNSYKRKNILKSIFYVFNKKKMEDSLEPLILEVENILRNINNKRFELDKKEMIRIHNYMYK